MAQAGPQFTPVQILEAGQRALADGRTEYAAQFFQHLIEHYASSPEAGAAHDAMARLNGGGNSQPPVTEPAPPPAPGYAPQPAVNGQRPGVALNGAGHANGYANGGANGYGHGGGHGGPGPAQMMPPPAHPSGHPPGSAARTEPSFGQPAPAIELPRHLARHDQSRPQPQAQPEAAAQREPASNLFIPAPEKNYIIGRVISGLLLLIGAVGIFAGIILVYAAFSDPSLFGRIGVGTPTQALIFSGSVFIGSLVMLIVSQVATALFDGSDAATDLARLERYRAGDFDEDEE